MGNSVVTAFLVPISEVNGMRQKNKTGKGGGRKDSRKIHIDRFLLSTTIKRGFTMEELKEGRP